MQTRSFLGEMVSLDSSGLADEESGITGSEDADCGSSRIALALEAAAEIFLEEDAGAGEDEEEEDGAAEEEEKGTADFRCLELSTRSLIASDGRFETISSTLALSFFLIRCGGGPPPSAAVPLYRKLGNLNSTKNTKNVVKERECCIKKANSTITERNHGFLGHVSNSKLGNHIPHLLVRVAVLDGFRVQNHIKDDYGSPGIFFTENIWFKKKKS